MASDVSEKLFTSYDFAKQIVCDEGYCEEIEWQQKVSIDALDESTFLRELAWVILSAGFRESVVRRIFHRLTPCFCNWCSADEIVDNEIGCRKTAMAVFNNSKKVNAIITSARQIHKEGFDSILSRIIESPIETLREFPFVGPVTSYHLAKNIGIEVAKPDRHLTRIATSMGFNDVQDFCRTVSMISGDTVPVVDIVFWRFATIEHDYETVLNCVRA